MNNDDMFPKKCICENCNSKINVAYGDIRLAEFGIDDPVFTQDYFYINCPVCKSMQPLRDLDERTIAYFYETRDNRQMIFWYCVLLFLVILAISIACFASITTK